MGGEKDNFGEYYDDIYYMQFKSNVWSKPKKLGNKINTADCDVFNCISSDGSQIYISRQAKSSFNIYVSTVAGKGRMSVPKKLDKPINAKGNSTCAYITKDGGYLLFASDRPGGYGGYDLYISEKLENGKWGEPQNLGPKVNSEYDELYPVLLSDGTLYFSSKGHETMGGFDVFKSTKIADTSWTSPVNMGYPLNTPYDDINFYPTSDDGKKGFYSSARAGGFGDADIYQYIFE